MRLVLQTTRRGWVFEVSKAEEAERYEKMRFLEDGWACAELCRAAAVKTNCDVGALRVTWERTEELRVPKGWIEPPDGWSGSFGVTTNTSKLY